MRASNLGFLEALAALPEAVPTFPPLQERALCHRRLLERGACAGPGEQKKGVSPRDSRENRREGNLSRVWLLPQRAWSFEVFSAKAGRAKRPPQEWKGSDERRESSQVPVRAE